MKYKPDWEDTRDRLLAFWNHAVIDRCCIAVHAPKKDSCHAPFPDLQHGPWLGGIEDLAEDDREGIEQWWKDPEQNYRRAITWFENTYFGGEALPITYINWGAMVMAAFFGSRPEFNKKSVWYHPAIDKWDEWNPRFDPATNQEWKSILSILDRFIQGAHDKFFVGSPELGNGADVLSLLRGMDTLAEDLIINPEAVKKGIDIISETWVNLMEQVHRMTFSTNQDGGVLAWMGLWAPGRIDQIACDFSSIISPAMFRQFFVPEIIKMGNWCEYGVYHLDGPACMKNILEVLLEIPQIKAIQFTPGIGSPPTSTEAYFPRYRKILESGRCLYLLAEPDEIERILNELPPEGLFLRTYVDTQEEAEHMLASVKKWSASSNLFPIQDHKKDKTVTP